MMSHTIEGVTSSKPGWDSFARTNASDRFRKQSAMMGTPLTELIVREARVEAGMRVLDVASGTGEPAISIASQFQGSGEVIATDISEGPLQIGGQRAQQRGLKNIRFQQADVHQLPFPNEYFDRVTCRLGLMFFGDVRTALAEIRRVLKPGSQFAAVAWGPMQQPYFDATIGTVLELCPELRVPDSAKAMFKFGQTGTLTHALSEVGFTKAHDELVDVDWTWHGTPEELWDYFRAVTVPFAPVLKAIPEDRRAPVNATVIDRLRSLVKGDSILFNAQFILATAVR